MERGTSFDEDHDRRVGQVARGVGVGSFGQGIGRLLNFLVQVILARMLGPGLFGVYILGLTIAHLTNILSQLGMDSGVVRYVAQYRTDGDEARVKGVIVQALLITFALSVLVGAVMFFGAGLVANRIFDKPFLETILKAFAFSVPFLTLMSMSLWATQGFGVVKYTAYVENVVRPLVNLALIGLFYVLGASVFGAVSAYVISMVVGSVLALRYLRKVFPKISDSQLAPVFETRALFRVSGPMIVASFMRSLNSWVSTLIVGALVGTAAVGIYNSAARTALLATVILMAFNGIFSPIISSLYRQGLMQDLDRLYKDVSRWLFTSSLVFFLGSVLLSKDVMSVFGPRFVSGWPVLVIIAGGQLFSASVGSTGRVLAMTDRQQVVMYATFGSVVLNVVLNFLLVPSYGIVGSAAATALAMFAVNTVALTAVRRSLGLWPYTHAYLKPVAAGLLALGAASLFRLALPIPVGPLAIPVVGGVYGVAFLAGLLALGLDSSDRQFLKSLWTAARRKVGKKKGAA